MGLQSGRTLHFELSVLVWAILMAGCAGGPPLPAPGKATLYGRVVVEPHRGVTPGVPGTTVYTDRRLRDVEYVDYASPGAGVVYLEGSAGGGARPEGAVITLEGMALGSPRFTPELSAVPPAGRITLVNQDGVPHPVSCPEAGFLRTLGPSERVELPPLPRGPLTLFALDLPKASARIFVAPGPCTVTTGTGAWELRDVDPGSYTLRAWHPRFPPAALAVAATPGERREIEVRLRVEDAGGGESQ